MVDVSKAVSGGVNTMVAFIISIIAMFVGFLFLPLLNGSSFLTAEARDLLEEVYPVLMILIPLFVLIGGLTVSIVTSRSG